METNRNRKVFGVYQNEDEARRAIESLVELGYNSDQISVVSRSHEGDTSVDQTVDLDPATGRGDQVVMDESESATEAGLKGGAAAGAAIGGVGGLLAGLGLLAIPGVGPILAAGPIAATLGGILAGGAVGGAAGTMGGAIADAGMPDEDARYIEERFEAGDIIIFVDAEDERYDRTSEVLNYRRWSLSDRPDLGTNPDLIGQTSPADEERVLENDPHLQRDLNLDSALNDERDLNAPDKPLGEESVHGNDPYDPAFEEGRIGTPPLDPHVTPGTENPVNPADPLWSNHVAEDLTEEERLRDEDFEKLSHRQAELDQEQLNRREDNEPGSDMDPRPGSDHNLATDPERERLLDEDVQTEKNRHRDSAHSNVEDLSQDSNFEADEVLDEEFVDNPEREDPNRNDPYKR